MTEKECHKLIRSAVTSGVTAALLALALAIIVIGSLAEFTPFGRDDSDPTKGWGARSGLKIYTDHRTGCQYLSTASGGLTPRLDKHGQHICGEQS